VSEAGAFVRVQRAIFAPADDISFYLFEALSADAVCEATTRGGLRSDWISEADHPSVAPPATPNEAHVDTRHGGSALSRLESHSQVSPDEQRAARSKA
jgi:hypothetical protein